MCAGACETQSIAAAGGSEDTVLAPCAEGVVALDRVAAENKLVRIPRLEKRRIHDFIGRPSIISRTFNGELSGLNKVTLKFKVAAAHNGRLIEWKVLCVILQGGFLCGFLVIPCAFVQDNELLLRG